MNYGILMTILHFFSLILPLLMNVAFVTLFERKILASSQLRIGPMKIGFMGLLQPFSDVVKLFLKQFSFLSFSMKFMFFLSPVISLTLSLMFISNISMFQGSFEWEFSLLFMLLIFSLNVYPLLLSGWSSNSGYGYLGALRSAAQTISYEISLAFIMISLFSLTMYLSMMKIFSWKFFLKLFFLPLFFVWIISILAELNRSPFDFSEGESELVSGFNIEYSATKFVLFFMAEYLMILILSVISSMLFLNFFFSSKMIIMMSLIFSSVILWARAAYPRFRYDKLMNMAWKNLLPISLSLSQLFILMSVYM